MFSQAGMRTTGFRIVCYARCSFLDRPRGARWCWLLRWPHPRGADLAWASPSAVAWGDQVRIWTLPELVRSFGARHDCVPLEYKQWVLEARPGNHWAEMRWDHPRWDEKKGAALAPS